MEVVHFRNFLGPRRTALCGADEGEHMRLSLDPAAVTCHRCLELLGRVRDANLGLPSSPKKPKS